MNVALKNVLERVVDVMQESAEKLRECYDDSSALIPDAAINTLPAVIVALSDVANGLTAILNLE
jgi:hypothetical protein